MELEIIGAKNVVGANPPQVVLTVRSWATEQDRINGVRERVETHIFHAHRLAPVHTRVIRDAAGKVQLTTGEFVDEADLFEEYEIIITHPVKGEVRRMVRERKKDLELSKETYAATPHLELLATLNKHYANIYALDARDTRLQTDDSDPVGIWEHPEMAKIKSEIDARGGK